MQRFDFYFGQKVRHSEIDDAFDAVEDAIGTFLQGFGYYGIANGADITEHNPTPNFTVDASGPALVYDQLSQKIAWSAAQNVDCTVDENGAATAVTTSGNEKYLTIFAEFERLLSDPRTDRNGATVFFDRAESFSINVVQGVEAPTGTAVKPAVRSDQVLLADVLITYGMSQIQNSDIDLDRAEYPYDLTGSPLAIKEKGLQDVLQGMVDAINSFDSADITSSAISDSPSSLSSGTIFAQLTELLGHVNDRGRLAAAETWSVKQTFSANPAIRLVPGAGSLANEGDMGITTSGDDRLLVRIGSSDRIVAQEPIQRTLHLPASCGHADWIAGGPYFAWFPVEGSTNESWQSQVPDGSNYYMKFCLNGFVPQDSVLNEIAIYVYPRGATSGTNGVRIRLNRRYPGGGGSQLGEAYDDGSDTLQVVEITGLTETFASDSYFYHLEVRAQTLTAGSSNWILWARVKFTDGDFARVP